MRFERLFGQKMSGRRRSPVGSTADCLQRSRRAVLAYTDCLVLERAGCPTVSLPALKKHLEKSRYLEINLHHLHLYDARQ